jgi:hypothetical protein
MDEKSLVPILQKQVRFYDDEITAVLVEEGDEKVVYVPIRPICDFLGVAPTGQRDRIFRDPVLSEVVTNIRVTRSQDQARSVMALPLDYVSGWLFGISANRVKEEVRERLIRYQRECHRVLAAAFREGQLTADPTFDALLQADSPAAQAYRMAEAIMKMARQQLLLEGELEAQRGILSDHAQRLETIEGQLGNPARQITPEQATQISQAVKAIALELGKRSGRNEYGGVYGELYRRFDINSYKLLPSSKFDTAMNWLNQWLQTLTDASVAF